MIPTKRYWIRAFVLTIFIVIALWIFLYLPNSEAETMYVNVSNESWLNGRESPDKSADVMCRFMRGDTVDVLDIQNGWAKVEEGGEAEYSYVSLDYLTTNPDGETVMTVSSDGRVRIRNAPDGKVTGYMRDGDRVSVSFFFSGWAKIKQGWIKADYLVEGA